MTQSPASAPEWVAGASRGGAAAHPGNCGRPARARSPGRTCSGRSPGGSRTSRASRGCPRRTHSHLRRRRLVSDSVPPLSTLCWRGGSLCPGLGDLYPWEASPLHGPEPDSAPSWGQLGDGSLLFTFKAPPSYPLLDPDPALTAAGPAPLAAVAGLTGNALEAPGFVLAFAIRAGARVSALVDVCAGGRRRTF